MREVIGRAFEAARLQAIPAVLPGEVTPDRIIGRSPAMQEMYKAIGRVAPQDVNVLILGECGAGKELVARAIYQHSKRADRPFLAINCAAIPETLLESELFGHEKGAFTGADRQRVGKFEQADGGTLFLDEVGDMRRGAGENAPGAPGAAIRTCRREPAGSHGGPRRGRHEPDLEQMVADGRFRKDLYYRLQGMTVRVPRSGSGGSDVAELAHHFLFQFNREMGLDFRGFAPEVLELFETYPWPGNVRELQGAIRRAMLTGPGHLVQPDALPPELRGWKPPDGGAATAALGTTADLDALIAEALAANAGDAYERVRRVMEARLFAAALARTHGNQVQASELLGLHRTTLRLKLRELGMSIERVAPKPIEHDLH